MEEKEIRAPSQSEPGEPGMVVHSNPTTSDDKSEVNKNTSEDTNQNSISLQSGNQSTMSQLPEKPNNDEPLNMSTTSVNSNGQTRITKSHPSISFVTFERDVVGARPVNSARSVEACRRFGVTPSELVKKEKKDYYIIGMSDENLQARYEFMEKSRNEKLEAIVQIYEAIKSNALSSTKGSSFKPITNKEELLKLEEEKLSKYDERRKVEIAQAILSEIAKYTKGQEILKRMEEKERERVAVVEEQRKQLEKFHMEKRSRVQQKMEQALEQQRMQEEEMRKQYQDRQSQLEEKRRIFEEQREEKRKLQKRVAEEKMKQIERVIEAAALEERQKLQQSLEKQSRANHRFEIMRADKEKDEREKSRIQAEKDQKRLEVAEKKKKDEEEKRNCMIEKQKQSELLLHTMIEKKRMESHKKSITLRLKNESKLEQVKRRQRAEEFEREQLAKTLADNMKRLEEYRLEKENIVSKRKQNTQANVMQKMRIREYIYEMQVKKVFKPPEWLDINLDDYAYMFENQLSKTRINSFSSDTPSMNRSIERVNSQPTQTKPERNTQLSPSEMTPFIETKGPDKIKFHGSVSAPPKFLHRSDTHPAFVNSPYLTIPGISPKKPKKARKPANNQHPLTNEEGEAKTISPTTESSGGQVAEEGTGVSNITNPRTINNSDAVKSKSDLKAQATS